MCTCGCVSIHKLSEHSGMLYDDGDKGSFLIKEVAPRSGLEKFWKQHDGHVTDRWLELNTVMDSISLY